MSRPRAVYVVSYPVWPPRSGGQVRVVRLARSLAADFDVDVVCLTNGDWPATRVEIGPGLVEWQVPRSVAMDAYELSMAETIGAPMADVAAGRAGELAPEFVAKLVEVGASADVAVVALPFLARVVFAALPHVPVVYDAHDVQSAIKAELLPDTDEGRRLLSEISALEADVVGGCQLVVACSPNDADQLRALRSGGRDVVVVPNGVATTEVAFVSGAERVDRGARLRRAFEAVSGQRWAALTAFVGSYHQPNIDAGSIIAKAAAEVPDVGVLLVGSHGSALRAIPDRPDNVVLTGVIDEAGLEEVLAAVDVALNPVSHGSGTNLKLLHCFAAGAPVLGTEIGARGVDARPGEHFAVTDGSAEGLARDLRRALDHRELSGRTASAARALVEESYDWTTIGQRFAELVASVGRG